MSFVSIEVEVAHSSTVGNVLVNIIHCIRLDTSGERDHTLIILCLRVPDDTLDETLATCLLYTSPSPRDQRGSRMPSSA